MRYASVCSGIEAATLAWESLGWTPAWFSQYDPEHNYKLAADFPSAVLHARWPHVPNLGNMLEIKNNEVFKHEQFDLLVGGTPCQAFSIAGLRKGMDDDRGQLTLEFVRLLKIKQPRWFVWENVPGVLSSNGGRDFAALLGALNAIGYSFSWRIIDAQYCGVPQRRRRVFVVGRLGADWRPSAAVLFESQSMPGHFKPSTETREDVAKCLRARANSSHREDSDNIVVHSTQDPCTSEKAFALGRNNGGENILVKPFDMQAFGKYGDGTTRSTVKARDYKDATDLVVGALDTECGFQKQTHQSVNAGHILALHLHDKATRFQGGGSTRANDGAGNGLGAYTEADPMYTLTSGDKHAVAFAQNSRNEVRLEGGDGQRTGCLSASSSAKPGQGHPTIFTPNTVRRLTPVECERLQGMPDHHTNIMWKGKPAPDGQRYKAIGNSMAVPVMHWLGKRIQFIEKEQQHE